MPCLKTLKNTAFGIASSFASRNNDSGGYWALGKLRILALSRPETDKKLSISLVPKEAERSDQAIRDVSSRYRDLLERHLGQLALPLETIDRARIDIEFEEDPLPGYGYLGPEFKVKVLLTIADGRFFQGTSSGRCRSHDPARENRRGSF